MHRIIFLDIDGVLNSMRTALVFNTFDRLDPIACSILFKIMHQAQAKIVVSSTWRMHENWKSRILTALRIADQHGITENDIIGKTPVLNNCRGAEIDLWLKNHADSETDFIILDDDSDVLDHHVSRFIKCDINEGLGMTQWNEVVKIWPDVER